ncbi:malate transporter [Escherichia coli]|nr:malate transporter [Escherichia coli]
MTHPRQYGSCCTLTENVATTEIIKATEESNGHRVSLPLSVFNPQDYHPLLITVSGKNVN